MKKTLARIITLGNTWGIYDAPNCYEKQYFYYINELGELAEAIIKNKDIPGELADVVVTMINADYCNYNIVNYYTPHTIAPMTDLQAISTLAMFWRSYEHSELNAIHAIANNHNIDFERCINDKLDILEKRKGKTINGIFIKNED